MNPADEQPVLYSSTGTCCHIPHTDGDRPVCSAKCNKEWKLSTYGKKHDTRRLCTGCQRIVAEHPRLAEVV